MDIDKVCEEIRHKNLSHYKESWLYQRRSVEYPYAVHFLANGFKSACTGNVIYTVDADIFCEVIPVTNQDTSIRDAIIDEPGMFPALVWEVLSRYGIEVTDDDILQLYNSWLDTVSIL